ncbi:MAG: hypothetical protein KC503_38710 [Myxococcales bacterium]|nr:hypothetical protein [Myxococcales bacterium]
MRRKLSALLIIFALLGTSGCGLLIAGGIAGGVALKRRSARKDALAAMRPHNDAAESAMRGGKPRAAMGHFQAAQRALFRYTFRWDKRATLGSLAAEYPEIARTARGLVRAQEALGDTSGAAAVAAAMLPPSDAKVVLRRLKMVKAGTLQVRTAPHIYRGMHTAWHGEVAFARHDPSANVTRLMVVPYRFVRRMSGYRRQRYYDTTYKIWRDRLVPIYRNYKVSVRHRAFMVELKGYNELIMPGTAATFCGQLDDNGALSEAVPSKIQRRPGGRTIWYLGVEVPTA